MSNNISIFGRLTGDPESKYSQNGNLVVSFTLADNRGDKASFFNCTAFGKTAENISKSLKGHRLYVSGRMEQDEWTDQQTGQQKKAWKVIVNDMTYIEPAPQQQPPSPAYGAPPQQYGHSPAPAPGYGMPPYQQTSQYAPPPQAPPNHHQYAPQPGNQPPQQYGAPPTYNQPPPAPQGQNWNPNQPVNEQNLPF